jgi:hypothetical protein
MGKSQNLIGMKFGKLKVISKIPASNGQRCLWNCVCDCGNKTKSRAYNLTHGRSKSCGCANKENLAKRVTTHGMSGNKIYRTWANMLRRCQNKNHPRYSDYGGRNISVCIEWLDFENFYKDMGEHPEGLTLDRIDNDKGYSKQNCRWATPKQQAENRRLRSRLHIAEIE